MLNKLVAFKIVHVALPFGPIFILKSLKTSISLAYISYVLNRMLSLNFIFTFAYSDIYRIVHLRVVSLRNIHSNICVRPCTSKHVTRRQRGFGGLEVACWPLVRKFAGSHPAEAVGFLGRKNPQHSFLRRGSKTVGPMS
jgi:hypothetical protein